jgi:hypothetical protein
MNIAAAIHTVAAASSRAPSDRLALSKAHSHAEAFHAAIGRALLAQDDIETLSEQWKTWTGDRPEIERDLEISRTTYTTSLGEAVAALVADADTAEMPRIGVIARRVVDEIASRRPLVFPLKGEANRPIRDAEGKLVSIVEFAPTFLSAVNLAHDIASFNQDGTDVDGEIGHEQAVGKLVEWIERAKSIVRAK